MSATPGVSLLRGAMLLGLAAMGAMVAAALMVSQADADLNRSDMDGYSYDASETACVDPDKWKDPFTIAFVDGATPGLVAQQSHDYGYIWDDSDPDQRFYDNDHCGFEHTDTANEPNHPLQSRFHMRTRTGSDGYLGQYDWDSTWGVFSVATPHYDKGVGCGHVVPEDYEGRGYSGFVAGRIDIIERWVTFGEHTSPDSENWYNTARIEQCNGERPRSDGWVWYISMGDKDVDGVPDASDNCPSDYNPGQENFDADGPPVGNGPGIDNGPGLSGADGSVPNGDGWGDACDSDDDNDGLSDIYENPLGNCGVFNGTSAGHPNPSRGDNTNDDDGNGNPAAPMGSDSGDNGPSWDTDNDGVVDAAECYLGYNPRSSASKPTTTGCGGTGDSDGDGLLNAWESCGWATRNGSTNSDADAPGDCAEAVDVDGNRLLNYSGDVMYYAKAVLLPPQEFGSTMDFELDKNGLLNYTGDVHPAMLRILDQVACD